MKRLRQDFLQGTITDDPLLVGATTFNSIVLADLQEVVAPNYAVIALDPLGKGGDPEIVHVTAHTAGATSATIERGKEGTTAREHALDTRWVHTPTIRDFERIARTDAIVTGDLENSEARFRLDDTAKRPQVVASMKDSAGALKHARMPAGTGVVYLARDFTTYTAPASVTEQTARSLVIPGGSLGPNGFLRVLLYGDTAGNGGNKNGLWYLGTTLLRDLSVGTAVSNNSFAWEVIIANKNNEAVQQFIGWEAELGNAAYPVLGNSSFVDTTVDQTLEFRVQKNSSGDTINVYGWLVELIQ